MMTREEMEHTLLLDYLLGEEMWKGLEADMERGCLSCKHTKAKPKELRSYYDYWYPFICLNHVAEGRPCSNYEPPDSYEELLKEIVRDMTREVRI